MSLADGAKLFADLEAQFAAKSFADATQTVTNLKLLLLTLQSASDAGEDAMLLGQRTLEVAVLLCVHASDTAGFQRNMSQLKAYYSSPALAARSEKRQMILGLHLLFLIVENRLAEFHSELELMAPADRTSREVAFSVSLEQYLMVGTYNNVLAAKEQMPAPEHFGHLMGPLLDTVRDTIAECAESAYDSLALDAAREMMMFDDDAALRAFLASAHPDWNIENGRIVFKNRAQPKSNQIPSLRLIGENLTYATELERII